MGMNWKSWAGFKYDKRWVHREGFTDLMARFWSQTAANTESSMMEKIASCRKEISQWKRRCKPSSAVRIQELQFRIDAATRQIPFNPQLLKDLRKELNHEYYQEEQFWSQKSRVTWFNEGDKNTKFFHATTKNRRAQNRIQKLIDDDGNEWLTDAQLGKVAEAYFRKLFASEDIGYQVKELDELSPVVTTQMNVALLEHVTLDEVKRAVFDINPTKCPGPDGMTGYLYQQFWDCMGGQLLEMVQNFFNSGTFDHELNRTNICLIPKKVKADKLVDFRPISLCNVIYKVIGKLLATRLKKVLPFIISESQAAFVKGRLISDNILVAHELLHALSSNNKCSEEFIALKTDISKAFDRVEWSFLENAMLVLGFDEKWVNLIMECVKSVRYQVLINGSPYGEIKPSRGIRQGDPLSPYLFIICTEMLIKMMQIAEAKGQISGLRVAREAPPVSHLLFADDSMFYCRETDEELSHLSRIVEEYSLASGQRVNYQKSSITFGKNISAARRLEIKRKLGIDQEGGQGVYLGLPESFKGSKVSILSFLRERLRSRISSWQNNFLSPGGKEVLLKAVAMSLPTYTMACFKLPSTVCQQIASVMAEFWWKSKKETRGLHWKAWNQLSKPKQEGGLGFRDVEAFNIAMLGKQLWRIITRGDSLLGRIYKSKYFRKGDPLLAPLGSRPSFAWKSIHEAQDLIKQGIRVVIGNGASTNIWKDPWISSKPAKGVLSTRMLPQGLHHSALNLSFVKDLIVDQGREWNLELLRSLFPEEVVSSISQIRLGACNTKDCFACDYSLDGQYSVKSGYWVQMQVIRQERGIREVLQPSLSPIYHQIWSSDNPPKIQHFLWRCVSNCLSVAGNLYHRHLARDGACARCPNHVESVNHLLFTCSFARLVWAISPIPAPPGGEWTNFIYQNMYSLLISNQLYPYLGGISKVAPWLLWRLWKSRNDLIFKGKEVHAQEVVKRAIEDMEEWSTRQEKLSKPPPAPISGNRRAKWSPPHSSWVKCNVDGAWSKESLRCGIGWILRDHENQVLWLGARALPMTSKALEVEIEGFRWAVLSLIRLNYRRIIFESDSQQTLNLIRGDMVNSHFSPIIQDIQQLLQRFEEVKLSFTFREGNGVTDRIAKESLSFQNYDPKLYSVLPDWVKSYVEAENCI